MPKNLDLAATAPLLCAGITTYSPLRHWKVGRRPTRSASSASAVSATWALKLAHALGAHVVLFTTSPGKAEDASKLGADDVVISRNAEEMTAQAQSFDFIIDTVSAHHDINAYLALLSATRTLALVGVPPEPLDGGVFD